MGWAGAIENARLREEIKRLRRLNEFYRQTYEKLMSNKTIRKALDEAISEGLIVSYGSLSSYGGGVEDMGSCSGE